MEPKKLLYLGKQLRYFVNNIKVIVYQGRTEINLLDYLPLLKQGYTYQNKLKDLMEVYQSLDKDLFDKVAQEAFLSEIPREFYLVGDYDFKVLMDDAIKEMYIDKPINSEELLVPERGYDEYVIGDLIDHNAYTIYDDKLLNEYSKDKNFIRRMKYESKIMEKIIEVIDILQDKEYGSKIDLVSFWNIILEHVDFLETLYNVMSTDDRIKLYLAIIEEDRNKVKDYLITIDPRFDDNQAYVLAVQIGDKVIIKIIKDDIIRREWLEKQVYFEMFGPVGLDIQKHHRK